MCGKYRNVPSPCKNGRGAKTMQLKAALKRNKMQCNVVLKSICDSVLEGTLNCMQSLCFPWVQMVNPLVSWATLYQFTTEKQGQVMQS